MKYGKGLATLRSSRMVAVETSPADKFMDVDVDPETGLPKDLLKGRYDENGSSPAERGLDVPDAPHPSPFTLK